MNDPCRINVFGFIHHSSPFTPSPQGHLMVDPAFLFTTITHLHHADMTNHDTLLAKLLAASKADTWEEAQLEWVVTDLWESPGGTCDCGHTPITDHLLIRNLETEESMTVGNVCVKNFFSWDDYDKIFKAIKKLRKDPSVGTPEILFKVTFLNRALDGYMREFLINRRLARKLTPKQQAFRLKCHRVLLNAWHKRSRQLEEFHG